MITALIAIEIGAIKLSAMLPQAMPWIRIALRLLAQLDII